MSVPKLFRLAAPAAMAALTVAAGFAPGAAGGKWRVSAAVGATGDQVGLSSVAASGPGNAWAVGADCLAPCSASQPSYQLVIDQWKGTAWQQVPQSDLPVTLPSLGRAQSAAVGTSSAKNVWVFAFDANGNPVGLSWNGAQWTQQTLPSWFFTASSVGGLSVETSSGSDVWVLGARSIFSGAPSPATFAAHFNGSTWSKVPLKMAPMDVSAISPASFWAVGLTGPGLAGVGAARSGGADPQRAADRLAAVLATGVTRAHGVAKRWTGRKWKTVRMPSLYLPHRRVFIPTATAAASAKSLWVSGFVVTRKGNLYGTRLLHWNGRRWATVKGPKIALALPISMAQDGNKGVWVDYVMAGGPATTLAHFAKGRWAVGKPPAYQGDKTLVASLSWIPGTRSDWGAGVAASIGSSTSFGVLIKHGR